MTILSLNVAAAVIIAALLLWFAADRRTVSRTFGGFRIATTDRRRTALELAAAIHARVPRMNDDPHFLLPALASIGASPSVVLRRGGCCSGVSRLYIVALDSMSIEAMQIALYHESGNAQHCLVEISVDGCKQVVDPTYGLAFERADGRPLSLADLQAGVAPRLVPLPGCNADSYPQDPYYSFDFPNTKTANWTKSSPRRWTYAVLSRVRSFEIDRFRLPTPLEWPQIILACGIALGVIGIDVISASM